MSITLTTYLSMQLRNLLNNFSEAYLDRKPQSKGDTFFSKKACNF